MADGLKDIQDIRSEPLTYRDSILQVDKQMALKVSEAFTGQPGEVVGKLCSLNALLLFQDSLVNLKSSHKYRLDVEKRDYQKKLNPRTWSAGYDQQWEAFLTLMDWKKRIVQEYPALGIVEPTAFTDVWGDKRQIYSLLKTLIQTLTEDELDGIYEEVKREGTAIWDAIPEGAEDDG